MNMLLFLLLVVAGEAAYYETTMQQQSADGFQQQEEAWQSEDESLRAEYKQLLSAKGDLDRDITATEATISSLNAQLHGGATTVSTVAVPAASQPAPAPILVKATKAQGNLTTIGGQKFSNCQLLKVEADGITFSHADGITKIPFTNLPADVQARFGVDPATGMASPDALARYAQLLQQ